MHNHGNGKDSGMMWMMLICCLVPVVFILFSTKALAGSNWIVIGAVALFVLVHFLWMRKGHCGPGNHAKHSTTEDKHRTTEQEGKH